MIQECRQKPRARVRKTARPAAIAYIPHPLFDRPDAAEQIEALKPAPREHSPLSPEEGAARGPAYIRALYRNPLLSPADEEYLFCLMNFRKYQAHCLSVQAPADPSANRQTIEACLEEALQIRNTIVECNLRLVVATARRFVQPELTLDDLISEGHPPLIRAVELFDCSRGFRFSTYATWAIRNRFVRNYKKIQQHRNMVENTADFVFEEAAVLETVGEPDSPPQHVVDPAIEKGMQTLPVRERNIVAARFGLGQFGKAHSFSEIGRLFDLSRERVRQLTLRSLDLLRAELS